MLYSSKYMDDLEYQIYLDMFNHFKDLLYTPLYIYMNTDPSICYKRVLERNRKGEETIDIEYLKICGDYHNEWLLNDENLKNKLIINGNSDVNKKLDINNMWLNNIDLFVNNYDNIDFKENIIMNC